MRAWFSFGVVSGMVLCAQLLAALPAHAALIDRGGGLIYDSALNITWLRNAGGPGDEPCVPVPNAPPACPDPFGGEILEWQEAMNWAANLSYIDSVRGVTWDDWRLPRGGPIGPTHTTAFSDSGGSDLGYAITSPSHELAHLYYVTLGNLGYCAPVGADTIEECVAQDGAGLVNAGPFLNVGGKSFWTASEWDSSPQFAWAFNTVSHQSAILPPGATGIGLSHPQLKHLDRWSWAVRDGDVGAAPVPEPASVSLLLLGLGAAYGARKRRHQRAETD